MWWEKSLINEMTPNCYSYIQYLAYIDGFSILESSIF